MRIRNLDTFYWIASLGGFHAASRRLNLTQPAISARIQVLEQDLGAPVFQRDVRNAELTPEGRRLFPFAERLVKLDQDVISAFSDTSPIGQTIRLGSSETVASSWLPDFLGVLGSARRGWTFELTVDATDSLRNALVARELDLAFLMGPVAEVSITNHDLCGYEMTFAAHPDIACEHVDWPIEAIADKPILTFANNTKPGRQIREMLAPHAVGAVNIMTSTSLGALLGLAKSGLGICAVPRSVLAGDIASGALQELRTPVQLPVIAFTASHVSATPASAVMAEIAAKAQAYLQTKTIENIYQS
jgi:DNA-binding transcriptional LysR family regulator